MLPWIGVGARDCLAPPSEPDRRVSRILCGAPHKMRYVASMVMWRRDSKTRHLLGFSRFQRHIIFLG